MRKISQEFENPIDDLLINLADIVLPYFRSLHFTPNMLTTISFFLFILSAFSLLYGKILFFSLFYLLSYWFDIIDGHYARTYQMETTFGDYYDHITDILAIIIIVIIISIQYKEFFSFKIVILSLVMFMLTMSHLGCQEGLSNFKRESKSLEFL